MDKKKKSEVILPAKKKVMKAGLKANLSEKHKAKKDADSRRRAEEMAKLPKQPVKRFFARLSPKRFFKWFFSWRGQKKILKFIAACFLLGVIGVGGLFLYYKKDLDEIRLDKMEISETVNTYLDRNGVVLWEDIGDADYRLVVDGSDISTYMRQATVAIEDKNFYNHPGVDFVALVRAVLATLSGQGVQGGSTLTQQLIKQVYFADEAASANRGGLTRKIKELILSIELERMYDKEQIITMYLNQSPYGGRRNGVESAAQTYFGKSAKDLNLAESALLASIPNNPGLLNPYNTYGNEYLIERQQKTLDAMASLGYISAEEAEEAKAIAILDTVKPESNQYAGIKAPHFVLEVKEQLEEKYGIATMRAGGFVITTTLDYRAQEIAEAAVAAGAGLTYLNKSDNIAMASVDVDTSQIIAMVGSKDFWNVAYGEVNAATQLLEPGSSIKPVLDYAPLFMQREGQNFGPGSILKDENIDRIYCAGYSGSCALRNFTGSFYGNFAIRQSLANSLNIPAVKALYINGVEKSLEVLHELGDTSYCEGRDGYGLAIAIGSGCGVKAVEHANTYASIARGGAYKDLAYILEIKNSSGDVIEKWEDKQGKQVVDPQVAYMISDILSDPNARQPVFGSMARAFGFNVPGVWTASKTGTTTTANSSVTKDSWMVSYSTAVATVVWNGNHDGSGLSSSSNNVVRRVVADYMEGVHKNVYATDGRWQSGDKPVKPAGIQTLTVNGKTDIWPSWYNEKTSGISKETLVFNKYTKKLAAECTPEAYKETIQVTKTIDPMSKSEIWSVPDGYDRETVDDCTFQYEEPSVSLSVSGKFIVIKITKGALALKDYELFVNGASVETGAAKSGSSIAKYSLDGTEAKIKVVVTDVDGNKVSDEKTL